MRGSAEANKRDRFVELLARIDAACAKRGLSRSRLCLKAGLKVDSIRTIARGNAPKPETLLALAGELGVQFSHLTEALEPAPVSFAEPTVQEYSPGRGGIARGIGGRHERASTDTENAALAYLPRHLAVLPVPGGGRLGGDIGAGLADAHPVFYPAALIHQKLAGEAGDFLWAEIAGTAMAPDLAEGDQVLIDRRAVQPVQPGMFAVDEGMGFTARWIEYVPGSAPRRYRVRCTDARFAPYDIGADKVQILGRIVWMSRRL